MRLQPKQINIVKSCISQHLPSHSRTWLFGSRLDDSARGGDVDLYVEIPEISNPNQPLLIQKLKCKLALEAMLQIPVDLIVKPEGDESPIAQIARQTGQQL